MSTSAKLREEYRLTREALANAASPELKRQLTQRAFELAQLAEKLERDGTAQPEPPPPAQSVLDRPQPRAASDTVIG